jgi:hypothetical protein
MSALSPAIVFAIANNGILIFWLLLIVAPRWRGTDILVHSVAVPAVLGLTYIWMLSSAMLLGTPPQGSSFFSLAGVMALLSAPVAMTAAWIHFLIFDLFIGAWEVRDAQRRGLSHIAVIPCLIVTLLFGPAGLLLYFVLRATLGKGGFSLKETPA